MSTRRPEAIDSRLVFHVYAAVALPLGIVAYMWPLIIPVSAHSPAWIVRERLAAAVIVALGICASAFASVADPVSRRRCLMGFAHAHFMLGAMSILQSRAQNAPTISPVLPWAALIAGAVLIYLAITGPGGDVTPALGPLPDDPARPNARTFVVRNKRTIGRLRAEYEEQIRRAARQEERARLARDLHDAVKQQLFAIQTAGATAETRLDSDPGGARRAIEQVRSAAREAMAEMEAMLDQLQGSPVENAGLVTFLRKQCEALGFQTGARVEFTAGALPDANAVDPGAREAIARVAQEALSNVARHARASRVNVSLNVQEGRLVLLVEDDGSGFDVEGKPRGMGTMNIAARAAEVGGAVDIRSVPGGGTTLRFSVPCADVAPARAYVTRAIVWSVATVAGVMLLGRLHARPLALMLALIGAIAVARYTAAAVGLSRRPRP
jgi:signal transduction histidine kinase